LLCAGYRGMSTLDALAAYYGIEESFRDARGAVRTTSRATRHSLLAAMGVTADTDETASMALAELHHKEWLRILPPVSVLSQAEIFRVPVNLPAQTASVSWQVRLEEGAEVTGEAAFESLALEARAEIDGVTRETRTLVLPNDLPMGYHRLSIAGHDPADLIISPGQCWLPPVIEGGRRLWGVSAQLYLLKSAANWGIGDYNDLKRLVAMLAERNADVVGLNPLHAMFLDDPEHASPYSPASRLLLNVLNIDVDSVIASCDCADARRRVDSQEFQAELIRCRGLDLLDYSGVAQLKLPILEMVFTSLRAAGDSPDWRKFLAFRQEAGEKFERGCLFLALREYWAAQSPAIPDWHHWPAQYRDPVCSAVTEFATAHEARVTFHAWLQYVADTQLGEAAHAGASMAIGLYRDLAVGADPSGAETWADRGAVVSQAQVGAPPDIYNPQGQDWGLPPYHPVALRERGYRSFIELVRANMRHAGGLRIDHVMALKQLYWVPRGLSPAEGAYVRYPFDDLIGILALESHRNRCLVVGEDLGTVPEGFRERISQANILSYRVLYFEKNDEGFIPPDKYPALSLAVAGSHDLPTLHAWWTGSDLKLKENLGLFPHAADARAATLQRRKDRSEFLAALKALGFASDEDLKVDGLIRAAHGYLASSASAIAMMQIDDITAEETPVNVPTTSDEHPNWRRRQSLSLEQVEADPRFAALSKIINDKRAASVAAANGPATQGDNRGAPSVRIR
jgi:4-alpha-glucanotransferase